MKEIIKGFGMFEDVLVYNVAYGPDKGFEINQKDGDNNQRIIISEKQLIYLMSLLKR